MKTASVFAVAIVAIFNASAVSAGDFQANTKSECRSASRAFVQGRYNEAMAQVRQDNRPNSPRYIALEKQHREFWLVRRFDQNLQTCAAWFNSGRTISFTPS